jgi:hypothetical protein
MTFKSKEEVAVMPVGAKSPSEVVRISRITYAGPCFVQTDDGRMYAASDGADLRGRRCRYIVPARAEHRAAIRKTPVLVRRTP